MIFVENAKKEFKKTVKEPGLVGSMKSLFNRKYEMVRAVDDISFHVPKGEILGFIGPNGAGKSTMIKMLTGILTPSSGQVMINGQIPHKNRKKYVREIGVVFGQKTQLWWDLPLSETFHVLKHVYRIDETAYKKRLNLLNEVLDLDSFVKSPVRTLSLGQRMRADIAASMLHNPKVLFLDEPTIGLDVVVKDNIRKAITEINQAEKTTIILTTHDLNDIETLCKRIVMIDKGKLLYNGDLKEMKNRFGNVREVSLSLFTEKDNEKFNFFDDLKLAPDQCEVTSFKENMTIKFDTNKVSVADMLDYVLRITNIKDMAVKDADIEDIVRRLYKSEVEMP